MGSGKPEGTIIISSLPVFSNQERAGSGNPSDNLRRYLSTGFNSRHQHTMNREKILMVGILFVALIASASACGYEGGYYTRMHVVSDYNQPLTNVSINGTAVPLSDFSVSVLDFMGIQVNNDQISNLSFNCTINQDGYCDTIVYGIEYQIRISSDQLNRTYYLYPNNRAYEIVFHV